MKERNIEMRKTMIKFIAIEGIKFKVILTLDGVSHLGYMTIEDQEGLFINEKATFSIGEFLVGDIATRVVAPLDQLYEEIEKHEDKIKKLITEKIPGAKLYKREEELKKIRLEESLQNLCENGWIRRE